ncbi:ring finger domain-containing [Fusarium longipes]|uniref:RBR-type E3 ubiquitin transferase n=1 Tax=Fusarium longipes TaxID=694270 RepID=A0A395RPI0_9HYPO|nr:ring finger domain-containing [Fusarium longipes]
MLRSLKNKASNVWQKRKASGTPSTPPSEVQISTSALAESELTSTVPVNNTTGTESTPSYQQNPYPLPPTSVPSTISTDLEHEQQPRRQPSYPLPPTSVPSTVSTLSEYQHSQGHSTVQKPVIGPLTPGSDPYTTKYVPYTDANPLKSNMFARRAGIYERVNPDIMGGFGEDNESIWLVDDEEEESNQEQQRGSQIFLDSQTGSTSNLALRPSDSSSLHNSEVHLQQPGATPAPSTEPAFRYQRPSFLDEDDDDLISGSTPDRVTTRETTSDRNGKLTSQRGYAPISASILDLTDLGVDGVDTKACDTNGHTEFPNKRPRTTRATAGPSSSFTTNPYLNLFEQQDDAMTTAYLRQLEQRETEVADEFRFGQRYQRAVDSTDVIVTHQRTARSTVTGDLECALSIESDLSSKLWTEIRCPECRELLEYADIQRYANKQTFAKYETIALRAAMSEAENFVWCTSGCGSGQIHESGSAQPIVTCLHCSHRSCFHHNVAWHETLSCEEYDQLLADPVNFRSNLELENEKWSEAQQAQLEADRAMAQDLLAEDQAEMRRREERARQEREQAQKAAQLARQIAVRRKKEEAQSNATVSRTTKPCAGCGWAIEKNKGCSHMTCIKCKHEFCFECGASHRDIMRGDNSIHKKTCPYHPDNLPDIEQ